MISISKLQLVFAFSLSLIMAIFLANLQIDAYLDRANYLNFITNVNEIVNSRFVDSLSILSFFNEPVWAFGIKVLSAFLEPESVLRVIIFSSTFIVYFYLLGRVCFKTFFFLFIVMLMPQFLQMFITHLRQGVALAVFIPIFFSDYRYRKLWLIFPCLIHSSFFVILFFVLLDDHLNKFNVEFKTRVFAAVIVCVALSFVLLPLANLLGFRQLAHYSNDYLQASGAGVLFWSIIAILIFIDGERSRLSGSSLRFHNISCFCLVFYCTNYFTLPVASRVLESSLAIVLITIFSLKGYCRLLAICLLFFITFHQWIPNLFIKGFGFGGI